MAGKGGPTNLEKEQVGLRTLLFLFAFRFLDLLLSLRLALCASHGTDVWDGGEGDGVQG
jgi:hypothetical protein